jgi:putative endonuclease
VLTERQQLGLTGEQIAARWLRQRGWVVLAHRFRDGHRDIDLIASRYDQPTGGRLVSFVEVRTRHGVAYGTPLESVNWRKQYDLIRSARRWISMNSRSRDSYRFDIVGVVVSGQYVRIQYVPNAFWAKGFG